MEKQVKQKGVCPHCGSTDKEIIDVQNDGFCTEHINKCNICKNKFIETYYLDYSETRYEETECKQLEMETA